MANSILTSIEAARQIVEALTKIADALDRIANSMPTSRDDVVNLGSGLREGWDNQK